VFFLPLVTRIDLFVLKKGPFDASEFGGKKAVTVRGTETIVVKSAEDSILRKLLGYVEGGEVSERQWRDVVEILRVSGATLESPSLDEWARHLGLTSHLARARNDAAQP
jgi:hypothetical protein